MSVGKPVKLVCTKSTRYHLVIWLLKLGKKMMAIFFSQNIIPQEHPPKKQQLSLILLQNKKYKKISP